MSPPYNSSQSHGLFFNDCKADRQTRHRLTDLTPAQSIWGCWYVNVFRAENSRLDAFTWNRLNGSSNSQGKFQPVSRYLKRAVLVKPRGTMQFSVSCKDPSASIKHISTDTLIQIHRTLVNHCTLLHVCVHTFQTNFLRLFSFTIH